MVNDNDDLFSKDKENDLDDFLSNVNLNEIDDLLAATKSINSDDLFPRNEKNIERFIPRYQQEDHLFYKSHLSALAYGLEELNSKVIDASDFSTPYEYITALSDQSLKEGKIDEKEYQKVQSFSEKINMIEEGGVVPLSFYKQGLADIYNSIIAPQLKESDKLETISERLTLDQAVGEIPYPLEGDMEREFMFSDLIHIHNIPEIAIDREGVLYQGKHLNEIGSSELSVVKMVIYEYMEGMWDRKQSEVGESIELSVDTKKLNEIGITQEMVDNMDMTRHGNYLRGNNAFREVVDIVSNQASKPYDEALMSMVSHTLKLDKNIVINNVKETEKLSVNVINEDDNEVSVNAVKVKANVSYKGREYEIERVIASPNDSEKMIFMNKETSVKENEGLFEKIKEQYGQAAKSSPEEADKRIVTMLYDNRLNQRIIEKSEENKPKKKLSNSLSI